MVEKPKEAAPGTICVLSKKECVVACKEDALSLKTVQLEGKKRMEIEAFLRGFPLEKGVTLGG